MTSAPPRNNRERKGEHFGGDYRKLLRVGFEGFGLCESFGLDSRFLVGLRRPTYLLLDLRRPGGDRVFGRRL